VFRCVLAATDGSDAALAAVRTAIELAESFGAEARLHVAAVIDYAGVPSVLAKAPEAAPDLLTEQAEEALRLAYVAAFAAGVEVQTHLLTGGVVEMLLECAQEIGADVLVAGVQVRNRLARIVMGSTVGDLVRESGLPVLVVRYESRAEA
jgi:nucleotide-binding universal stress UspA family protein